MSRLLAYKPHFYIRSKLGGWGALICENICKRLRKSAIFDNFRRNKDHFSYTQRGIPQETINRMRIGLSFTSLVAPEGAVFALTAKMGHHSESAASQTPFTGHNPPPGQAWDYKAIIELIE